MVRTKIFALNKAAGWSGGVGFLLHHHQLGFSFFFF